MLAQSIFKNIKINLFTDKYSIVEKKELTTLENKFDIFFENFFENDLEEIGYDFSPFILEDKIDFFINQIAEEDEDENIFTDSYFINYDIFFLDYNSKSQFVLEDCYSYTTIASWLNFLLKYYNFN